MLTCVFSILEYQKDVRCLFMTGLYSAISFTFSRKLPCVLSQSLHDGHDKKKILLA